MIDQMRPQKVLFQLEKDVWISVAEVEGCYVHNDVIATIQGGTILLTAETTRVRKLMFYWDVALPEDALLLGDAWERGYGDMGWKAKSACDKVMPWYFLANCKDTTYGFGVKNQPNAMCFWTCVDDAIALVADVSSGNVGVDLHGRQLVVAELVFASFQQESFQAARSFCAMMCSDGRIVTHPIYGGNDWYSNYGDNSYEKIIALTKRIVDCSPKGENRPYMVIDAGWALCFQQGKCEDETFLGGPWKYPNEHFRDMEKLAQHIKSLGARPGIWIRPLQTAERLPASFILKRDGIKQVLDPSQEGVLDLIRADIARIKQWGYEYIKHDFTCFDLFGKWGFEAEKMVDMDVTFGDQTRTTAEIIKGLYWAIREAAGDTIVINACNTFSHLSAGVFDIMRTGDDTSGTDWERTKKMGVNTLAFRMPQHQIFYTADADCVGITSQVPWKKNKMWLDVLAKSGTPVFVSIADDVYTDEVQQAVRTAFSIAAKNHCTAEPKDWEENCAPIKWETLDGLVEYHWDD